MKAEGNFLAISILVAALIVAGTLIYVFGPARGPVTDQEEETFIGEPPMIGDDYVLGEAGAPITIIEFGDYQCPFCGRFFSQTEPQIREDYIKTGKAKLVYKDLAFLGQESIDAALAANCAGEQNKFWEYHDLLFETEIKDGEENNGNLKRDLFLRLASQLGLGAGQFASCYDSRKYDDEVQGDLAEANNSSANATPTFFINNQIIQGAVPYNQFTEAIEKELK